MTESVKVKVSTELAKMVQDYQLKKGFLNELISKLSNYDKSGFIVKIVKWLAIKAINTTIKKLQDELNELNKNIAEKFIEETKREDVSPLKIT